MPVTPTYPGVYIEEISSGVHTITGVATSITAFLGRAARGDTTNITTINSFADFVRNFGGLDRHYPMTYAVRDFYQNGGSQAIIVRLDNGATIAKLTANGLPVQASSEGTWGNKLKVRIDLKVSAEVAAGWGLAPADLFNLSVQNSGTGSVEKFLNLTIKDSPNRADRTLQNRSSLLRLQPGALLPANFPTAHPDPPAGKSVWDDAVVPATFSKVAAADFAVDGAGLDAAAYQGDPVQKTGIFALEEADLFNLLCIPEDTLGGGVPAGVYSAALDYCVARRAMLIVDPPPDWSSANDITAGNDAKLTALALTGDRARNGALYFPLIHEPDPNLDNQPQTYVPCGMIAGVMARTDAQRGVWKAPAGIDASLN